LRIMEVFPRGTIWELYGATEAMGTVISPGEWLFKPGSVGRPFPGLSVRVLDEDGHPAPPGEVGTIYISSFPGAAFSYRGDPEKTAAAYRDGFATVGDLGHLDEHGYLFIADRRTDLILSGGANVYPAEVENALAADPDVVDSAVIGLPDERMGQRVHAIIELRTGAAPDASVILDRLSESLAPFKRPRTIEFVDTLPREPNGKVLKRQLQAERAATPW
jgi:long-chain acyl-CoA synthetase